MNLIKETLAKQGRSQKWLSQKIGKSYVIVTNYCNNKTQPKLSMLGKIAKVLEVETRDLIK